MPRMTPEQLSKLPKTRDEAAEHSSVRYFTGEPCKRGHVTYRYTTNNSCAECTNRFIAKSRVSGVPVAFRVRNKDALFAADPELSTKVGIILLNDHLLQEWLVARAQRGENGFTPTQLRFEAGPLPLKLGQLIPTEKCNSSGFTLSVMSQNGWTPEQLVAEGYAESVTQF